MPSQVYADRIQETTATTGTGAINLAGAVAGYLDFVTAVGTTNTCDYLIVSGTAWEVGNGTVTAGSPNTLSRDTVFDSSAAGGKITLAGTSNVYLTFSAYRYIRRIPIAKTVNYSAAASDSGTAFTNTGAVAEVDFTLPDWAAGLWFIFTVTAAQILKIILPASNTLCVGSNVTAAAGSATSGAVGSSITLLATDVSDVWMATSMVGPWTLT